MVEVIIKIFEKQGYTWGGGEAIDEYGTCDSPYLESNNDEILFYDTSYMANRENCSDYGSLFTVYFDSDSIEPTAADYIRLSFENTFLPIEIRADDVDEIIENIYTESTTDQDSYGECMVVICLKNGKSIHLGM